MDKYIEENKLEIPSLEGKAFVDIMEQIVSDKKLFAQLLCLIAVLVNGRHITIIGDLAKASIQYKIEKKAYLLNIILDILFYLEFIVYEKITEECISIRILNEDMANELNNMKFKLKDNGDNFSSLVKVMDEYYSNESEFKDKYNEIKEEIKNDNTRTSK